MSKTHHPTLSCPYNSVYIELGISLIITTYYYSSTHGRVRYVSNKTSRDLLHPLISITHIISYHITHGTGIGIYSEKPNMKPWIDNTSCLFGGFSLFPFLYGSLYVRTWGY